MVGLCPNN